METQTEVVFKKVALGDKWATRDWLANLMKTTKTSTMFLQHSNEFIDLNNSLFGEKEKKKYNYFSKHLFPLKHQSFSTSHVLKQRRAA